MRLPLSLAALFVLIGGAFDAAPDAEAGSLQTSETLASVLTQRGDKTRGGVNLHETLLTPHNVESYFGKLWEFPVEGDVYAQPLYIPRASSGPIQKNILLVATMQNFVYAFDADRAPVAGEAPYLWRVQTGRRVSQADLGTQERLKKVSGYFGILSTPVVDAEAGLIYAVSYTVQEDGKPGYRLFKLRLSDGQILASVPVQGSLPGRGPEEVAGRLPFNPEKQLQRPGLLLHHGYVHIGFGSMGDHPPFHGWLFSYRVADMKGGPSFITTPSSQKEGGGGIWQSGAGLTVDEHDRFYVATGNGDFSVKDHNWGDSVLKLAFNEKTGKFSVLDFFSPSNQAKIDEEDMDLGAAGVLFIPPRFLLSAGKPGKFFLLDREHLGGYHPDGDQVLDEFQVTDPSPAHAIRGEPMWNIHGTPVFWDGQVYVMGESDPLKAFRFDPAQGFLGHEPVGRSRIQAPIGMPGGFITLTANGNDPASGVVWVSHPVKDNATWSTVAGVLRAFDAKNLDHELWNSLQRPGDDYGMFAKFCAPSVVNGKVYLATFGGKVVVYGLRPPRGEL